MESSRSHAVTLVALRMRQRLARLGVPPLEESTPAFSVGEVAVYLFGPAAGAPDPRLLEAIDWHTGVAGRVDDERARTLLTEAVQEGEDPRAHVGSALLRDRVHGLRTESVERGGHRHRGDGTDP